MQADVGRLYADTSHRCPIAFSTGPSPPGRGCRKSSAKRSATSPRPSGSRRSSGSQVPASRPCSASLGPRGSEPAIRSSAAPSPARPRRDWNGAPASPADAGFVGAGLEERARPPEIRRRLRPRRGRHGRLRAASRIVQEVERRRRQAGAGRRRDAAPADRGRRRLPRDRRDIGYAELSEIWRQVDPAMRRASVAFARGEAAAALGVYREAGMVRFSPDRQAARRR